MNLYEEDRTCGAEDVKVIVFVPPDGTAPTRVMAARCPFVGPVEVRYHRGEWDWECPRCSTEHRGEIEEKEHVDDRRT